MCWYFLGLQQYQQLFPHFSLHFLLLETCSEPFHPEDPVQRETLPSGSKKQPEYKVHEKNVLFLMLVTSKSWLTLIRKYQQKQNRTIYGTTFRLFPWVYMWFSITIGSLAADKTGSTESGFLLSPEKPDRDSGQMDGWVDCGGWAGEKLFSSKREAK